MKLSDGWISGPMLLALVFIASGLSRGPAGLSVSKIETTKQISDLSVKLKVVLEKLPAFKDAEVKIENNELQLQVQSDSIFSIGTADAKKGAGDQVETIARFLLMSEEPWQVLVEGHTDQSPVVKNRDRYPSNWELSGARALYIARTFEEAGIPGQSLRGVGFAATQPKGSVGDENRRIVIRLRLPTN